MTACLLVSEPYSAPPFGCLRDGEEAMLHSACALLTWIYGIAFASSCLIGLETTPLLTASETTIFNLLYTRGVDMRYSIVHRMVDAAVSEPAVMENNISLRQGPSGRPCRIKAPCLLTPVPPAKGGVHMSNDLPTNLSHQELPACTAPSQLAEPLYHLRVSFKCLLGARRS